MFFDLELWVIIGALFTLFIFGLIFLFSTGGRKRKKRRPKPLKEKEQKNWKEAALRLEKHLVSLRKEGMNDKKQIRILEKQTEIYKHKCDDLKERLKRANGWQEKEAADLKKKGGRILELEGNLKRVEENLEKEHAELIVLRRQNDELNHTAEGKAERIRTLQAEAEKIKAQSDVYRKDILDLRAEVKKLSQRHEDTQWVAKSVYNKVREDLREKTEELERLQKQMGRE